MICIICGLIGGCGKARHVAEVEGVLLIHGQPGRMVRVQFVPDVDHGMVGPTSLGETDSEGKFTLLLNEGSLEQAKPGAIVGWHRVVLTDLQYAASQTGAGVPVRFSSDYSLPGSSRLRQEVKEGKQTIEIKIP